MGIAIRWRWVFGALLFAVALIELAFGRWGLATLYVVLAVALPLTLGRARYRNYAARRFTVARPATQADDAET